MLRRYALYLRQDRFDLVTQPFGCRHHPEHGRATLVPEGWFEQWAEIGEATHLLLLEKNRLLAFQAVRDFYDSSYKPETAQHLHRASHAAELKPL